MNGYFKMDAIQIIGIHLFAEKVAYTFNKYKVFDLVIVFVGQLAK